MHLDPQELARVAEAVAPRVDLYAAIHKALRALMADTLLVVGRMDADDALELAQVTERVMALADFCLSHLTHENEHVHTAIEARASGASEQIAHEHDDHVRHIAHLAETVAAVRKAGEGERDGLVASLYRELALFVAGNFQHMHVEETAHNAVLWARYTDAELMAIHGALVGSIPPQEMMFAVRWMVPFMSPKERVAMLADMRGKAPPAAFDAVIATVRPHLTPGEWKKLEAGLGI